MKKACLVPFLLSGLIAVFLFFLSLKFPPFVLAQFCGVAGPKIAGNINPSNYAQIRDQYDKHGCTGQPIPVTVIYSVADLSRENRQTTLQNLQAMNQYNLVPIIRVSSAYFSPSDGWARITPEEARTAGETLSWLFTKISFPDKVNVYFGNEPDLSYEWGGNANAKSFGESFAQFILGAGIQERSFNILIPPMATHTGQVDFPFLKTILDTVVERNLTIADLVDGAALTIYGEVAQVVSTQYQKLVDYFTRHGIPNNFIITELGPLYQGALLQGREDVGRWVQIMESIFQKFIADHALFPDVQFITTSFFLDLDGDGHPDITLLVIVTADGEIIILNLATFGGGIIHITTPTTPFPKCVGDSSLARISRPDECNTCNLEPPLTYACATTFTVHDAVSWQWQDSDFVCEPTGEHWVEKDWGGIITVDPSQVTVPFVGKKGEEDVQKYLADYFEGTAFYYGPDIDLNDCKKENPNEAEREACQEAVERVTAEGGVFRKLAPKEYQDKLKKEMIQRAKDSKAGLIEDGIHDYLIEYAGLSARLSQINPPPEPPKQLTGEGYEEWKNQYNNWKKTSSGKLWAAVPMFSREDSPGKVVASVNTKKKDNVAILPPVQEEEVPHLARLFEVTRELRNLLMPWLKEGEGKVPAETLLASSNPQVLGEKKLLAQGGGLSADFNISLSPKGGNKYDLCFTISGHASGDCNMADWSYQVAPYTGEIFISGHRWDSNPNIDCHHLYGPGPIPVSANPGDKVCATLKIVGGACTGPCCDPDPRPSFTQTKCCEIAEDGTPINCGVGEFPEPPQCGLAEPPPYPACEYESITDENPNDTICCTPIKIDLKAIDQFANPNYTGPCVWITDPATGERGLLNPDCKKTETRHVYRDVKVDLFHPYLDEIWEQTTDSFRGLFNIFRPSVEPAFEDLEAHSYVKYYYDGGSITPSSPWKFYFPHLGGIQKAKEWVLETLNPSSD